ncbi:amyloid-beta A4 precursor protein-binding family A member 2-like [Dunckerocampus dactyliophorus]|uniref:amyloid-beta A4 precursor protein-binding family A member 2-like n=1 Tax=Dunckerocampus dactyliophorus TaxID=161453 RepID=UPI0024071F2C|nr:amyloid-beta A4 precursor protein-binding family A member 2-like [Dunckerocampus dactyliophorus]XP_054646106.1 amyloid-beta A4 precursor protein-binding family A member 2-like [Dunckerocampus dactyliophorus]
MRASMTQQRLTSLALLHIHYKKVINLEEVVDIFSTTHPRKMMLNERYNADDHPSYKDVPGPCDPEDLLDGVIFGAKYLGSTQIKSERNPSTNARMAQAQEAVDRIKEAMMDHALQMISYIADIGDIVVLMARRKRKEQETTAAATSSSSSKAQKCLMVCHVFSSEDAQVIAQAIGQAFGVAYQQFLQVNGIKASDLRPGEYSDYLESQELYNGDLAHFSDSQNIRDIPSLPEWAASPVATLPSRFKIQESFIVMCIVKQ